MRGHAFPRRVCLLISSQSKVCIVTIMVCVFLQQNFSALSFTLAIFQQQMMHIPTRVLRKYLQSPTQVLTLAIVSTCIFRGNHCRGWHWVRCFNILKGRFKHIYMPSSYSYEVFQFHKGAIQTLISTAPPCVDTRSFNSIKVRFKLYK